MPDLFLRLFTDPKDRSKVGAFAGIFGIVCNLLLSCGKIAVGLLSGSIAVTADALNNFSDAASSVVTLLGFRLAEKPADGDHPYGHARYEYLAGLAVAAMMVVIGFELGRTSVGKLLHPEQVIITPPMGLALGLSILVKCFMAWKYRRWGKFIQSPVLETAAADSRSDAAATGAVLLSGVVETTLDWRIDGFVGLLAAVYVLWSGVRMAKKIISPLLGEAADPELRQRIADLAQGEPLVLGCHDLLVHDYGPGRRFASLHVEMDRREDPLRCHEVIDALERRCLEELGVHLVIHYDPIVRDDPALTGLRERAKEALEGYDPRLTLHDLRPSGETLRFDVSLPDGVPARAVEAALEKALPEYRLEVTYDPVSGAGSGSPAAGTPTKTD